MIVSCLVFSKSIISMQQSTSFPQIFEEEMSERPMPKCFSFEQLDMNACPICIGSRDDNKEGQSGSDEFITLKCGHEYHKACLKGWLDTQLRGQDYQYSRASIFTCPMCRRGISPAVYDTVTPRTVMPKTPMLFASVYKLCCGSRS